MNKYIFTVIAVLIIFNAGFLFSQDYQSVQTPVFSPAGPQCNAGEIHDLGVVGSNLGWNTGATSPVGACLKFIPPVYPYRYTKFCMNFSRLSTGTSTWNYKIYMWKSVNGKPGPRMDSVEVTVTPGILPNWNWFDFDLPATWKEVTSPDSVFIGFLYDAQTYLGGSFAIDVSASLPVWPGFTTQGGVNWTNVSLPTYKSWLMRAEGAPSISYAHDVTVVDFLSPANLWKKDSTYTVKAKVKNAGTSPETNVPFKFLDNGVVTGATVNINLSPGAIDSVSFQWTPAISGAHKLKIASALATDQYKLNDTANIDIRVVGFPQYYNYLNGTGTNVFPFGQTGGKATTSVYLPGEFNHPSPVPTGKSISKIYFSITSGSPTVFSNLMVLLAQDTITSLSSFYTGTFDTVYNHSTVTTNEIAADMFYSLTLDHPFPFDPSKSLIMSVGQCGSSTTAYTLRTTSLSGNRRVHSLGGCPFTLGGTSTYVHNIGIDVTGPTSVIGNPVIPEKYSLEQNYPNPFNPVTNIKYNIPKSTFITLKVFDMMGKEVQTLINEYKNAGSYDIRFDGSNLSSGIYYYRFLAGDYTESRSMVLIK